MQTHIHVSQKFNTSSVEPSISPLTQLDTRPMTRPTQLFNPGEKEGEKLSHLFGFEISINVDWRKRWKEVIKCDLYGAVFSDSVAI